MTVTDPGKLLLFGVVLICSFLLVFFDRSPELGGGAILYVLGYLTGNGRLALGGKDPVPTLGHRPAPEAPQ